MMHTIHQYTRIKLDNIAATQLKTSTNMNSERVCFQLFMPVGLAVTKRAPHSYRSNHMHRGSGGAVQIQRTGN